MANTFLNLILGGVSGAGANSSISEWASWTPTGTWNTNTTYVGMRRRVGSNYEYRVEVQLTGAPNAATLQINLGDTIDDTKLPSTDSFQVLGNVVISAGTLYSVGLVGRGSATQVIPRYSVSQAAGSGVTHALINATTPATFANGHRVYLTFSVPIVGLSA